nr:unnamed protein product [Digitaria exilis]
MLVKEVSVPDSPTSPAAPTRIAGVPTTRITASIQQADAAAATAAERTRPVTTQGPNRDDGDEEGQIRPWGTRIHPPRTRIWAHRLPAPEKSHRPPPHPGPAMEKATGKRRKEGRRG